MASRIASYMRTHRRRWGLSQKELARLLGVRPSQVSRWERLRRKPKLSIVFAYQVLFGVLPHELLPRLYAGRRVKVRAEAERFLEALNPAGTRRTKRKRELLARVLEAARDD